jgi:hypothetical protein
MASLQRYNLRAYGQLFSKTGNRRYPDSVNRIRVSNHQGSRCHNFSITHEYAFSHPDAVTHCSEH